MEILLLIIVVVFSLIGVVYSFKNIIKERKESNKKSEDILNEVISAFEKGNLSIDEINNFIKKIKEIKNSHIGVDYLNELELKVTIERLENYKKFISEKNNLGNNRFKEYNHNIFINCDTPYINDMSKYKKGKRR